MSDDYTEQIILELSHLERIVEAIKGLIEKTELRTADIYDKAADSSFLSQFYNGIENILKRV